MKEFLERFRTDPVFKSKMLRAGIFFFLFLGGIIAFAITTSGTEQPKENQNSESKVTGNYIPGDSTGIGMQKNEIYARVASDSLAIMDGANGHAVLGGSITDNQKATIQEDNTLDQYMRDRRKSVEAMQNSGSSSGGGSSNSSTSYRRSYNPNGTSGDWTSDETSASVIKETSPKREDPSKYRRNYDPEQVTTAINNVANNLPQVGVNEPSPAKSKEDALKKRRLLLQSGKANADNTRSFKGSIEGTQLVKNGQLVKLKVLEDVFIANTFVPKYTSLYGSAHFNDQRVTININSIKVNNDIITCNVQVFGLDGQEGIPVTMDALSASKGIVQDELTRNINTGRLGGVISSILNSSKRNEIKIKLVNNQNILFSQRN